MEKFELHLQLKVTVEYKVYWPIIKGHFGLVIWKVLNLHKVGNAVRPHNAVRDKSFSNADSHLQRLCPSTLGLSPAGTVWSRSPVRLRRHRWWHFHPILYGMPPEQLSETTTCSFLNANLHAAPVEFTEHYVPLHWLYDVHLTINLDDEWTNSDCVFYVVYFHFCKMVWSQSLTMICTFPMHSKE